MPACSLACGASIVQKCLLTQEIFIARDSAFPTGDNYSLCWKLPGRPLPIFMKIVWLAASYKPCHEYQPELGILAAIRFSINKFNAAECSSPLPPTLLGSKCGQR